MTFNGKYMAVGYLFPFPITTILGRELTKQL